MTAPTMAHFGSVLGGFPEKVVARAAGVHPKTAARWKRAESMPGADDLMRLMRDDEIFLAVLRHIGRDEYAAAAEARHHLELALAALEGRK